MKALVFKEQVDYDIVEIREVLMVPDKTPELEDLQKQYQKDFEKKITSKVIASLGDKARFKNGRFTPTYFKMIQKTLDEKKFDFTSWMIKTHKAKQIKFESN